VVASGGLRERRKAETRSRLGDVAARLFAERGYDTVSISDVARAAGVADQTVYNYFPTKADLVLDRAGEVLQKTRAAIASRAPSQTTADAMRTLVHDDIDRYVDDDPTLARGQFPAQCRLSAALRRRVLEFYDELITQITSALIDTALNPHPMLLRSHAAALVAVTQQITEAIGDAIIADADRAVTRRILMESADDALDDIAIWWRRIDQGSRTQS